MYNSKDITQHNNKSLKIDALQNACQALLINLPRIYLDPIFCKLRK